MPNTARRPAARKGPVNIPNLVDPPNRESARARNARGTWVAMKACRAKAKAAAAMPITKTAPVSQMRPGRSAQMAAPTRATVPAMAIVCRSPIRPTNQPAGMLPHNEPTMSADATNAAVGMSAPR